MKTNCAVKVRLLLLSCFTGICIIFFCQVAIAQKQPAAQTTAKPSHAFTYKIMNSNNGTYGYDIYAHGRLLVHQPSIPALPGNDGFTTKAAAEKVARRVIQKMQKGEMPPTITIEELKELKAI